MVSVGGSSHHYIPAAFLGRFSPDTEGRLRERRVWVLKAGGRGRARLSAAESVGCVDNLYQLYGQPFFNQQNPSAVDDVWARYEQRLGPSLDELSKTGKNETCIMTIPGKTWLRVLVPFVTGLFVRGKEWESRYSERMKSLYASEHFSDPEHKSDNTNVSRLMEFQRLLAPVMSARWVVMHVRGDHPVITNELGFTFFRPPDGSSAQGVAIPISTSTILGLVPLPPNSGRCIMRDRGKGQWRANIEHVTLNANDQRNFNAAMANIAEEFLAGPTKDSVEIHHEALRNDCPLTPEFLGALWPNPKILRAHEFEWFRAVTAIAKKSSELKQSDLQKRDWNIIAKDWTPIVSIPTNLRDFPSGLLLRGDKIYLAMTEIPGFTEVRKILHT
ncbi:DUF4238 domain-containing protein [Mycobacterium colombiense]